MEQPVKYEIKYQGMCGILPCQKTRIEVRLDQSIKTLIKYEEKPACCQGYTETPDRQCTPICLKSCSNGGKCVAPNLCKCSPAPAEWSPGFVGPTCSRFTCLGENRWGSKCDKECNCPLNAYCSASTGKCVCYPGYRGANCTIECDRNSSDPECDEINELPPILENDANLSADSSFVSRQRSEALILERTPDETLQDDRSSFGANYLASVLACMLLISVIGFLIYKRRYNQLKNEMLYSSGGPPSSGNDNTYSTGSTYYATGRRPVSLNDTTIPTNDLLVKNLNFAAATRQFLLGEESKAQNTHQDHDAKPIVNPLIESRLVRSHQQAEQNLYSEVKVDFLDRPLPNPERHSDTSIDMTSQRDDHHIYQVPKSHAADEPNSSRATGDPSPLYKLIADDAIYEEIKPREPQKQNY